MTRLLGLALSLTLLGACGHAAPSLIPPQSASRQAALSERVDEQESRVTTSLAPPTTRAPAASRRSVRLLAPPRTHTRGVERWRWLVASYDWPVETALRVMGCESGGDENAYNASFGATGLYQILHGPFDPAANVSLAHRMWVDRGWSPWASSRRCSGVG